MTGKELYDIVNILDFANGLEVGGSMIMTEKYETPEVEFVEITESDVIVTSGECFPPRGVIMD